MKNLNDDELISDTEANNSADDSSEPKDEMETATIDGNFEAAFYCPDWINLQTSLAEQVASL